MKSTEKKHHALTAFKAKSPAVVKTFKKNEQMEKLLRTPHGKEDGNNIDEPSSSIIYNKIQKMHSQFTSPKPVRDNIRSKIQHVLNLGGKVSREFFVGFNSLYRGIQRKQVAAVFIAKDGLIDCNAELVAICRSYNLPYIIVPGYSNTLKEVLRLKHVFCFGVPTTDCISLRHEEYRKKLSDLNTKSDASVGVESAGEAMNNSAVDISFVAPTNDDSDNLEFIEGAVDELRDYITSLNPSKYSST